jgi:hypothetical protein
MAVDPIDQARVDLTTDLIEPKLTVENLDHLRNHHSPDRGAARAG